MVIHTQFKTGAALPPAAKAAGFRAVNLMKAFSFLFHFFLRFRYPVSLPEEIASDLGVDTPNSLTFQEFINRITSPSCRPKKLSKFMSRDQAEQAFQSACFKERFQKNSLYSYYFNEGWMEFVLKFDDQSRLRRVYIHHKTIHHDDGIEIPLT